MLATIAPGRPDMGGSRTGPGPVYNAETSLCNTGYSLLLIFHHCITRGHNACPRCRYNVATMGALTVLHTATMYIEYFFFTDNGRILAHYTNYSSQTPSFLSHCSVHEHKRISQPGIWVLTNSHPPCQSVVQHYYTSYRTVSAFSDLQWVALQGSEHQRWGVVRDTLHLEWGHNGPRVKQVGVIAHFTQLH